MSGKGDRPRPYSVSPEQFEANYNAIFRKAEKAKAREAVQRRAMDKCQDAQLHHVGSSPRPMAAEVRINKSSIRQGRD